MKRKWVYNFQEALSSVYIYNAIRIKQDRSEDAHMEFIPCLFNNVTFLPFYALILIYFCQKKYCLLFNQQQWGTIIFPDLISPVSVRLRTSKKKTREATKTCDKEISVLFRYFFNLYVEASVDRNRDLS